MKTVVVAALLMAATASASPATEAMFRDFKATHGKAYASADEERARYEIFAANMKKAAQLNRENPQATFGPNAFADMSQEEFKTYHNAARHYATKKPNTGKPITFSATEVKAAAGQKIDWVKKGAVTHVKNQGQCGSCWSFSTTGNIEGQHFLATGNLVSVSEQELVSCDTTDNGCNGGLMDNAFTWLINNRQGQIVTEASYPYVSGTGYVPPCAANLASKPVGAVLTSYHDIQKSEDAMAAFMLTSGPIAIAVDAGVWQTYTGGIVTNCPAGQIDHGVLAVGFDDTYSTPYWIIKNSWGPSWGEQGYIRVQKGTNQCNIKAYPTTSVVSSKPNPTPAPGPSPTPGPSPSGGSLTQMDCFDSACSAGCRNNTFALDTCLPLNGGGSAIAHCEATTVTLTVYPGSANCQGFNEPNQMPLDQCVQGNAGYFENFCTRGAAPVLPKKLQMAKKH